jgi:hypothetical protein
VVGTSRFERLLREPLTHFFAIGFALFLLYGWLNRDAVPEVNEIVVDQARIEALAAGFERTWQRPPTAEELQGLVENWVREEVYFREGVAMRLDEGDPVVRRRIAQKMSFISDGLLSVTPEESELETWLSDNAEDYRIPASYTLQQVFIDPERHGDRDQLDAVVGDAMARLEAGDSDGVGDATLLPGSLSNATSSEIERTFGSDFAASLEALPVGEWSGPVASAFGVHLVNIEQSKSSRIPSLDEVRDAVERDATRARLDELNDELYEALREKYPVRITANVPQGSGSGAR